MIQRPIDVWHRLVEAQDVSGLDAILADDAVFHSPIVHTPQQGKGLVRLYLTGAFQVLFNSKFHYVREVVTGDDAMLEFEAEVDGIHVNGVDMIRFDREGRITDFKVMLRPLKAIQLMHRRMAEMIQKAAS